MPDREEFRVAYAGGRPETPNEPRRGEVTAEGTAGLSAALGG